MKQIAKFFLCVFLASVTALLSGRIPVYKIPDLKSTIGDQTYYGLPFQHLMSAPGLAWADWNLAAFGANVVFYGFIYGAALRVLGSRKK